MMQTTKHTQKGKRMTLGTNIALLPRVVCCSCGKPIAWGVIPHMAYGEVLLLKCVRRECQQFTQFDSGTTEAA